MRLALLLTLLPACHYDPSTSCYISEREEVAATDAPYGFTAEEVIRTLGTRTFNTAWQVGDGTYALPASSQITLSVSLRSGPVEAITREGASPNTCTLQGEMLIIPAFLHAESEDGTLMGEGEVSVASKTVEESTLFDNNSTLLLSNIPSEVTTHGEALLSQHNVSLVEYSFWVASDVFEGEETELSLYVYGEDSERRSFTGTLAAADLTPAP